MSADLWTKCPSVTPGGREHFYYRPSTGHTVVWHRIAQLWVLQHNHTNLSYHPTAAEGRVAADSETPPNPASLCPSLS